jgi:hypothetical protein
VGKRGLALLLAVVLAGCTRVIDSPQPASQPPVAPITAIQVVDLLSPEVQGEDGNLFVTVEPEECVGVAREVDPPFISDLDPAATDGGHWNTDQDGREVYIEEMVGVYRANFEPTKALANAKRTIESCRGRPFWVTSMREREYVFELLPHVDSGSPDIVLWSFKGDDWACDNAFVAAHNAAVEITTCGPANGYDVLSLARDALKRIETLANTTA